MRLMLCKLLQLDGKIIAPTGAAAWGSGLLQWIEFTKLKGITIRGKGIIDGQGSVWWNDSPTDNPAKEAELVDATPAKNSNYSSSQDLVIVHIFFFHNHGLNGRPEQVKLGFITFLPQLLHLLVPNETN